MEIGGRSVAITILGNLAYWNGRRLRWDPARWEFVDDVEANRWLDRDAGIPGSFRPSEGGAAEPARAHRLVVHAKPTRAVATTALDWTCDFPSPLVGGRSYRLEAQAKAFAFEMVQCPPHELFSWAYAMKLTPPPYPQHRSWMPEE